MTKNTAAVWILAAVAVWLAVVVTLTAADARADGHVELGDLALYDDVPYGHPHYDGIRYVTFRLGSDGFGDGSWGPDRLVTRGQLASLLEAQAEELGR